MVRDYTVRRRRAAVGRRLSDWMWLIVTAALAAAMFTFSGVTRAERAKLEACQMRVLALGGSL